jgi:hypothetical protein
MGAGPYLGREISPNVLGIKNNIDYLGQFAV